MFRREHAIETMKAQGRSNKWAGEAIGKDPGTIGKYLSGKLPCLKDTAIAWAVKMGLPDSEFWDSQAEQLPHRKTGS